MDLKGRINFVSWCLICLRSCQRSSESQVKDQASIPDKGTDFHNCYCLNRLRDLPSFVSRLVCCVIFELLTSVSTKVITYLELIYQCFGEIYRLLFRGGNFQRWRERVLPKRRKFLIFYTALNCKILNLQLILAISKQIFLNSKLFT